MLQTAISAFATPIKFMRLMRSITATGTLVLCAILSVPASAQVARLDARDYGKVVLPARQSLGGAAATVSEHGNVFEPINQLRPDDRLARIARAVGRLDLLIVNGAAKWMSSCTATMVSSDMVLTNYHCVPGLEGTVVEASLVLDYLVADGTGAQRITLDTVPVEADATLDYALVRMRSAASGAIEPIRLSDRAVVARDRLRLIHHPAGQPKMMTQFHCAATIDTPANGPSIRHTCDTLPGSSGAIVFDHDDMAALGLHHSGGLNANDPSSFNIATSLRALIAHSPTLRRLAANGPAAAAAPRNDAKRSTGNALGDINNALTGSK